VKYYICKTINTTPLSVFPPLFPLCPPSPMAPNSIR